MDSHALCTSKYILQLLHYIGCIHMSYKFISHRYQMNLGPHGPLFINDGATKSNIGPGCNHNIRKMEIFLEDK